MARIPKLIKEWRDSGMIWWLFAGILGLSARDITWPTQIWLQKHWVAIGYPSGYTWAASAIYFSFWIWVFVFLAREGKRYPGMILDGVCGGGLLAVATALHETSARAALADLGFGGAAWVTFLCTVALVAARSVQPRERRQPQQR